MNRLLAALDKLLWDCVSDPDPLTSVQSAVMRRFHGHNLPDLQLSLWLDEANPEAQQAELERVYGLQTQRRAG